MSIVFEIHSTSARIIIDVFIGRSLGDKGTLLTLEERTLGKLAVESTHAAHAIEKVAIAHHDVPRRDKIF
jgi:hypothetical protein